MITCYLLTHHANGYWHSFVVRNLQSIGNPICCLIKALFWSFVMAFSFELETTKFVAELNHIGERVHFHPTLVELKGTAESGDYCVWVYQYG